MLKEFLNAIREGGVNGPAYRGAPQPPFNELSINESQFEDQLRIKSMTVSILDDGYIVIDYEHQEFYDDYTKLKDEIARYIKANITKYTVTEVITVEVHAYDRDMSGSSRFILSFNNK